jgi:hypothetical protein
LIGDIIGQPQGLSQQRGYAKYGAKPLAARVDADAYNVVVIEKEEARSACTGTVDVVMPMSYTTSSQRRRLVRRPGGAVLTCRC